jgi:hypothetical protein
MRGMPRPQPQVYSPTHLQEATATENVPASKKDEVDKLAGLLRYFGESIRAAERKDLPIIPLLGEIFPQKKGTDRAA